MTTITSLEADSWNLSTPVTVTGPELVPVVQGDVVRTVALNTLEQRPMGTVPQPKIIQFGQVVTTTYVKANIETMEKNSAFDGFVLHVDFADPLRGNQHLCDRMFCNYGVDWSLLTGKLDEVKTTKFSRFTENYLRANGALPGTVDWFDAQGMQTVLHNWGISAKFAREAGLKGLWLDMETTAGRNVFGWSYNKDYPTTTFAQYQAVIKKYGALCMNALQAYFPNIDINLTFGYEEASQTDGADLTGKRYGLYTAFLDGFYDAARGATTVTNMMELAYGWQKDVDFDYGLEKQQTPPNCNSTNYQRVARYGYSIWLDYGSDGSQVANGVPASWDDSVPANNWNTPAIFQTSLGKMLSRCGSTGKVEIYNQVPRWWNVSGHDMPQVYRDALLAARTDASIELSYSPSLVPGVKAWMDPSSLSALANDAAISTWTDRISSRAATNTSTNRPTYKTDGFGSALPAILFTAASSQYLNIHSLSSLFTGTVDRNLTIVLGFQQTSNSPAAFGYFLGMGRSTGAAAPERAWGISSTPRLFVKKVNDATSSTSFSSSGFLNVPNLATSSHVLTIREIGATLEFRLDGVNFSRAFTVSTSGTTMTGTGFTANLGAGNVIVTAGGVESTVVSVDSNTSATLSVAFSPDLSSAAVSAVQRVTAYTQSGTATLDQARIGCNGLQTAATFDDGMLGDLVICDTYLEDADLKRLERYIGARCGATVA